MWSTDDSAKVRPKNSTTQQSMAVAVMLVLAFFSGVFATLAVVIATNGFN